MLILDVMDYGDFNGLTTELIMDLFIVTSWYFSGICGNSMGFHGILCDPIVGFFSFNDTQVPDGRHSLTVIFGMVDDI